MWHEERLFIDGALIGAEGGATYDNAGYAAGGVTAALEMLRDYGEDAGWQGHVEESVGLRSALFKVLEVLVQLREGLVPVILPRNV